ncbi:hypothetical protein Q5P01_003520 [Channa striata]|uniref:Secreted protein n=1 Tax=Channa striata TaxID=64152 RepID=A0AA88T2S8_CHASR|nr:hypothetical protein Q5P01_003520 [Channa striata]
MAAHFPIAKASAGLLSTSLAVCLSTTGPPPPRPPGHVGMSAFTGEKEGKKNPDRDRKRGRQGGEEKRMMKNKANARVAASGQRSISLFFLQGLLNRSKDKGRLQAKASI